MQLNKTMRTKQMPDKSLLSVILALLIFGLIMSSSASLAHTGSYLNIYKSIFFIIIGLTSGLIILNTPILFLQKISVPLFILSIILLAIVFLPSPIGHEVNGSRRWINFVFFKFQPSELMKISMILFMAGFLIRQEKDIRKPWIGFIKTICIIGIADFLLLFEADVGATLIISLTALAMLYAAGSYIKQLTIVTLGLFTIAGTYVLYNPTRLYRFASFFLEDKWQKEEGLHQTQQALIGIARGEWFGTGLGGGIQKYSLLPEPQTDMIFSTIGEELGIIGMLFVLLSFLYVMLKGFSIAKTALQKGRNYSSYVVFGICTWFSMQITVNIGMNLGLLPPKGFTLPLLSYGGTSMIFSIIALAIVLKVDMENRTKYSKQKQYV